MIFGDRIKQARELRGLTQAELAERLKVHQPYVAQVENQIALPSADFMAGLVFQLGFPPSFFEQQPTDDFPQGSLLFRAKRSMTDLEGREVYRWAQTVYDLYRRMSAVRRVKEPPLRLPQCRESPEVAASVARSELGIAPEVPIPNLINTLEKAGVFVMALPRSFEGRDAFSLLAVGPSGERRPVIVIVAKRPADRLRMSVAHELGHLIMHQPLTMGITDLEDQAKRFAACFMLPAMSMRSQVESPVTLETFMDLKVKWGVSMQALIVRSHELGIITQRKYHYLFSKLAARGWRTREPLSLDVPLERPRMLRQMAELVYGYPINYQRLATDAKMQESFVREVMEAHAARPRTAKDDAGKPTKPKRSPDVITFSRRKL